MYKVVANSAKRKRPEWDEDGSESELNPLGEWVKLFQECEDPNVHSGDGKSLFQRFFQSMGADEKPMEDVLALAGPRINVAYDIEFDNDWDPAFNSCFLFYPKSSAAALSINLDAMPSIWTRPEEVLEEDPRVLEMRERQLRAMQRICESPRFRFPTDKNAVECGYESRLQAEAAMDEWLSMLGLSYSGLNIVADDNYEGGNHAAVFRQLMKSDHLLFIECSLAMVIADLCAYLEMFGDEDFNHYMDTVHGGGLGIVTQCEGPILGYSNLEIEQGISPDHLRFSLKHGNRVYIRGVRGYDDFHPSGSSKGINAFVVEDPETGEISFVTFDDRAYQPCTYTDVIQSLTTQFSQNLTYEDLWTIDKDFKMLPGRISKDNLYSYADIVKMLNEENTQAIYEQEIEKMKAMRASGESLDGLSGLRVPSSLDPTPIGIVHVDCMYTWHTPEDEDGYESD